MQVKWRHAMMLDNSAKTRINLLHSITLQLVQTESKSAGTTMDAKIDSHSFDRPCTSILSSIELGYPYFAKVQQSAANACLSAHDIRVCMMLALQLLVRMISIVVDILKDRCQVSFII